MAAQITVPTQAAIYRGDTWRKVRFQFHADVSTKTFACQLRHSKTSAPIEVQIDTAHQADDPDPYIDLVLDGDITAGITDNLLHGDLEAGPKDTWFTFTVPVLGQYTIESA